MWNIPTISNYRFGTEMDFRDNIFQLPFFYFFNRWESDWPKVVSGQATFYAQVLTGVLVLTLYSMDPLISFLKFKTSVLFWSLVLPSYLPSSWLPSLFDYNSDKSSGIYLFWYQRTIPRASPHSFPPGTFLLCWTLLECPSTCTHTVGA